MNNLEKMREIEAYAKMINEGLKALNKYAEANGYKVVINQEGKVKGLPLIKSKLVNGMKSKCERFTLNIDKGYVGVATQTADGTCRMVYTEPVDNEENIIKDLEDLFNFNITEKYIDSWIENWCSMDFKDKYNDKTTEELCNLLGVFGHRSSSYFKNKE